jgi:thioredoxin reductase
MFSAACAVDFSKGSPFTIKTDDGKHYEAEAVIVTAARRRAP